MKRPSLLFLFCCAVFLGSSPAQTASPPAPSNPLEDVNKLFLSEYAARIDDINSVHPLYIEVSGNNLILHRDGQEDSKRVIPEIFHTLKDVSHVPFLVYLRLASLSSKEQLSESDIAGMQAITVKISAARDALPTGGFNDIQMQRQQKILDRSLAFLNTAIEAKRVTAPTLENYTHAMSPLLVENVNDASCYAIQGMHAQMMQWKTGMTSEEWGRIVVINPGVIQPRYRSLAIQYFGWLFRGPAPPWAYPGESERVIYSEFQHPTRNAAEVLASFRIDEDTSVAFFADKWRLSEDLLGDGAARCIARLRERDRLWHP